MSDRLEDQLTARAYLFVVEVSFVADRSLATLPFELKGQTSDAIMTKDKVYVDLTTRDLAHALWVFFDIFFAPTARVSCAYKLGMILETRRVCFTAVRIPLRCS